MFSCEFSKQFLLQNTFRRLHLKKYLYGSSYEPETYKKQTNKKTNVNHLFYFSMLENQRVLLFLAETG